MDSRLKEEEGSQERKRDGSDAVQDDSVVHEYSRRDEARHVGGEACLAARSCRKSPECEQNDEGSAKR